jgi:hypothetical protein
VLHQLPVRPSLRFRLISLRLNPVGRKPPKAAVMPELQDIQYNSAWRPAQRREMRLIPESAISRHCKVNQADFEIDIFHQYGHNGAVDFLIAGEH